MQRGAVRAVVAGAVAASAPIPGVMESGGAPWDGAVESGIG